MASEFLAKRCVAVGFTGMGDMSSLRTLEAMKGKVQATYPEKTAGQVASAAGVAHKFRSTIKLQDQVLTYDPETRLYHFGEVTGDYEFKPGFLKDYEHVRAVTWTLHVSRDVLTPESRNSLGSTITIFEPGEAVLRDLKRPRTEAAGDPTTEQAEAGEVREEVAQIYEDQLSRSHEFIKDRINRLEHRDMEHLAAALLRALGFKSTVTPIGPDRGRDVMASPDGLGLQSPRIICEVKHREGRIGAQDIRSFVAGLRSEDRGLYVSTGGFTKEAKYEADRATIPTTLVDLDELAKLVVEHYERFDTPGRALLPLARFYWPVP